VCFPLSGLAVLDLGQALILSRKKLENLLRRIEPLPAPAYAAVVAVAYWFSLSKVFPRCSSPAGGLACGSPLAAGLPDRYDTPFSEVVFT
jgi:hypothetical protein